MTVATTADTLELQYLKNNSLTRNVNISVFKHNQTILLFTTPKKSTSCQKQLMSLCVYTSQFSKTLFWQQNFFFYSKSSSKSPLSLFHVIDLLLVFSYLFSLRCLQAVFPVEAKLQRSQGPMLLKTGWHSTSSALLQMDLPPSKQGMWLLFFKQ